MPTIRPLVILKASVFALFTAYWLSYAVALHSVGGKDDFELISVILAIAGGICTLFILNEE